MAGAPLTPLKTATVTMLSSLVAERGLLGQLLTRGRQRPISSMNDSTCAHCPHILAWVWMGASVKHHQRGRVRGLLRDKLGTKYIRSNMTTVDGQRRITREQSPHRRTDCTSRPLHGESSPLCSITQHATYLGTCGWQTAASSTTRLSCR